MKFNIKPFRINKKYVLERYSKDGINSISFYCSVSYCPVIAAYSYILEEFPENEDLKIKLNRVMLFYGYEGIVDE